MTSIRRTNKPSKNPEIVDTIYFDGFGDTKYVSGNHWLTVATGDDLVTLTLSKKKPEHKQFIEFLEKGREACAKAELKKLKMNKALTA